MSQLLQLSIKSVSCFALDNTLKTFNVRFLAYCTICPKDGVQNIVRNVFNSVHIHFWLFDDVINMASVNIPRFPIAKFDSLALEACWYIPYIPWTSVTCVDARSGNASNKTERWLPLRERRLNGLFMPCHAMLSYIHNSLHLANMTVPTQLWREG